MIAPAQRNLQSRELQARILGSRAKTLFVMSSLYSIFAAINRDRETSVILGALAPVI